MEIEFKIIETKNYNEEIERSQKIINEGLYIYLTNQKVNFDYLYVTIQIGINEVILGGITAFIEGDWMIINNFWITKRIRKKGFGSKVLNKLEDEAVKKNIKGIRVETLDKFDFNFYLKRGYEVFGELENYPTDGNKKIFLKKILKK